MIKALLIGCGNIGAGYDLHDDTKVWTHAKAYSQFNEIELSVFDADIVKAKETAGKYAARHLEELPHEDFAQYDMVSLTTPTTTHFEYLQNLLSQNVPVIICEKPAVSSSDQVDPLIDLYKSSKSKVIVNYIRRFQDGYKTAKQKLNELCQQQSVESISIKYKRGFLNNASHALDLLEFFFEQPFTLDGSKFSSVQFDAFDYDPTLAGSGNYMNCPVNFIGVAHTAYAIFEMELFFSSAKVVICHSGNEIRYYYEHAGNLQENLAERQTSLLNTYMLPVVKQAVNLLTKQEEQDNFIPALRLNKEILRIIEPLKSTLNATVSH